MAQAAGQSRYWAKLQTSYQQAMSHSASPEAFVQAAQSIEWDSQPAELFRQAIDMALQLEALPLARRLAQLGHELHPASADLERAARVLAPPRVLDSHRPPVPGIADTMSWLQEHGAEYQGLWVAVKAGKLLGSASSRQELVEQLGDEANAPTLITRIL